MEYSYPILRKVFKEYSNSGADLSNVYLYSCQHLLAPQYEMYKLFIEFGFKSENIIALGKAYSSNTEVIQELQDLGIRVVQPKFTGVAFDIEHKKNCEYIIKDMDENHINIILDDGAELIKAASGKNIYAAVEQTSSGFRKLEGLEFNFPIINVARSNTKLTQESPLIARLVFERIKNYMQDTNLVSPVVTIVGLGPIGNAVLQICDEENIEVQGFDIETSKSDIISHLADKKPDIVIGATGTTLFDISDLSSLEGEHVYHFISVSSSDREFPVANFRTNEAVHADITYKNFVFVNNGFPITFKGNRYESTPIEIEKTIALLAGAVFHSISCDMGNQKGIVNVCEVLESLVNN